MLKPKKRESLSTLSEVHNPGFLGVQSQPEFIQDRRHPLQGLLDPLAGGAQNHQVICVLHQLPQPLPAALPRLIEHVQSNIGE